MSTGAPPGLDIKTLIELLSQVTIARYFVGVALTLCLYDWLVLLERESQTLWKSRWTLMKAIYYINRVMTLAGLCITAFESSDLWTEPLPLRFCSFHVWFVLLAEWASLCLSNTILTLRIVALYNRHKLVKRLVYGLLIVNSLTTFAFCVHSQYLLAAELYYAPLTHLCASKAHIRTTPAIFITPAVCEFILFAFTVYRAIGDVRNKVLTPNMKTPVLVVLYRDGFYYFGAVFAVHLWNSLAYITLPLTGVFMGVYFAWAVMTVMSSRVYLNLVLVSHGGGTEASTIGLVSPRFHAAYRTGTTGTGGEWAQVESFGAKKIRHTIPLTTFTVTGSVDHKLQPDVQPP